MVILSYVHHFHGSKARHFTQPKSGPQAAFYAWRRRAKRQREVRSILLKQVEQLTGIRDDPGLKHPKMGEHGEATNEQ